MDDKSLRSYETACQAAATEIRGQHPDLASLSEVGRSYLISDYLKRQDTKAHALNVVLSTEKSLSLLSTGWLQIGGLGFALQYRNLAHLLIDEVLAGSSASELLTQAERFAEARSTLTRTYLAVSGVEVGEPMEIKPHLRLIPWGDVPEGYHKKRFTGSLLSIDARPPSLPPSCAIELTGPQTKILFRTHEEASHFGAQHFLTAKEAHDLKHCLVATANGPITLRGSWTALDNPVADKIGGRSFQFGEGSDWFPPQPLTLNRRLLNLLVLHFDKLKEAEKNSLRVALDRLNRARRNRDQVDKAIDLGIALEAMLLHGDEGGEITFRLAVRGAALLGGTPNRKIRTFKALKSAYHLRSTAVHTGALKPKTKPVDRINAAMPICAQIARRIIVRGAFPTAWEREIVLA